MKIHFILYVADQHKSTVFYSKVLNIPPALNVPGMTEFRLGQDCILGLMPEEGAERLFGERIQHPELARGIPRTEVYLVVDRPEEYHERALAAGGAEISSMSIRDWGHRAAYILDPDSHVVAFAAEIIEAD